MRKRTKVLVSAVVVGVFGSLVAFGIFGQFSSTTSNSGNEITTGTVTLSDNDVGQALFSVTNAQPGDSWARCIKVTYSGSLEADVRAYVDQEDGSLLPYMRLTIEPGTATGNAAFPSCSGFEPFDPNAVEMGQFPPGGMDGSWDTGMPVQGPTGAATWQPGDTVVTRFTMRLTDETPNVAMGASTGVSTLYWEARNVS